MSTRNNEQMPRRKIEINCDAGEIDRKTDDSILPFVSSCNVCCGAHAGDETLIEGTIKRAIEIGINVGAHPSWPDRQNFGRKSMELAESELRISLREQILLVKQITESNGGQLQHVKPHGALYHDVLQRQDIAGLFLDVVSKIDPSLSVYGQADSAFQESCEKKGIRFVHEAFGDRRYESATKLRARTNIDALIKSESDFCNHMQQLIDGSVIDVHGQTHTLTVQTICLHSDTPNAINFARLAHEIIAKSNNQIDDQ